MVFINHLKDGRNVCVGLWLIFWIKINQFPFLITCFFLYQKSRKTYAYTWYTKICFILLDKVQFSHTVVLPLKPSGSERFDQYCLYISERGYEVINLDFSGKSLVMFENYTYSYQGRKDVKLYLYCSKRLSTKCPARLKLDKEGYIVLAITDHNHEPPRLMKIKNGKYIKIS